MLLPFRDDNPRQTFPVVTVALIAINTLVQAYQSLMSPKRAALFVAAAGAIPKEIVTLTDLVSFPHHPVALVPIPLTLLSSMFVHGGWFHLLSNMWYLWIFGDNIEDVMGHGRYALFYLLVGLCGALAQVAASPGSEIPMVGASGAIAGVLGGYALRFPRARVHCLLFILVLFTVVNVPASFVLGFWFFIQLARGWVEGTMGGVAWFAHIGGFVAGMALVKLFARPPGRRPRWDDERWSG